MYKKKAHLIIPRAMRAQLNPQLNDLKHLIIEHFPPDIQNNMAEEVIDSLLWLAPRPNTISFITKFAVTDSIKVQLLFYIICIYVCLYVCRLIIGACMEFCEIVPAVQLL